MRKHANKKDLSEVINDESYGSFDKVLKDLQKISIPKINFIVAIDFSFSNHFTGYKTYRRCMHEIRADNPYIKAIEMLKPCIQRLQVASISAMRFGDEETLDTVLPLNGDDFCVGSLDKVLEGYKSASQKVQLSGPTSFVPLFEAVSKYKPEEYKFLLILTDGDLADLEKNSKALVSVSQYPISVAALGFGDGPFDQMEGLDQMKGRCYDNFTFGNANFEGDIGAQVFKELVAQIEAVKQLKMV